MGAYAHPPKVLTQSQSEEKAALPTYDMQI